MRLIRTLAQLVAFGLLVTNMFGCASGALRRVATPDYIYQENPDGTYMVVTRDVPGGDPEQLKELFDELCEICSFSWEGSMWLVVPMLPPDAYQD